MALTLALGSCIGLVLALTGAGAGILAIPMLVFALHLPLQQAAPVALLAIGSAAAIGAGLGLNRGVVRYRAAAVIGFAGMLVAPLGVYLAQLIPNAPLQVAFASILLFNAWRVLARKPDAISENTDAPCRVAAGDFRLTWTLPCARALAGTGLLSGLMSGLLGVGGGFVIIPALSKHTNLDFRSIQATSLAVIALVSLSGVSAAAWHGALNWSVALPFAGSAVISLILGRGLSDRINAQTLQAGFALLCAVAAALMLARALGLASI